ncbi:zeta toxin family protein [uncultured Xanthomonas sp.]|uniref:zeta toxin family protein n=1 Tax=uncultured Xanthomonas sp. TaxID=152831 RepID=UPI0025FDD666|nr:zeta toxin family protein [uncultured Xanthomonas sp.]
MSDGQLPGGEHERIFGEEIIPKSGLSEKSSFQHPRAVILAGQPGAGKGSLAEMAERELDWNVVKVDPDKLREFHPQVSDFRDAHPYTWSGFTHPDASQWAEELLKATVDGKKNLIFDTTLSNGEWSAGLIKDLQARGYEVEVRAMAAHKLESEFGVDNRFSNSLDTLGHGRYVPEGARDVIYDKLPASLEIVQQQTTAPIRLFNREGVELYDSRHDTRAAGQVLREAREARLQDPAVTRGVNAGWQGQRSWHAELPEQLPHNANVAPGTAAQLLAERAQLQVVEGVERHAAAAHTVDFNVRVKPVAIRGMGILGAAATVYDAAETGRSVGQLQAQGNAVGAQAQLLQFGARNVGGWAGGALGAQIGAVAGVETGPGLVLTGLAGGVVGAMGANEAVQWLEQRRINNQTDRTGVDWSFDPKAPDKGWTRTVVDAFGDHGLSVTHQETAPPQIADELTFKAASRAVQLRLATPDVPIDPYRVPADASDRPSLREAPWERDGHSGQWTRQVADGLLERNVMHTVRDRADPEKAAALDAFAQSVVAYNASRSPAAIAAAYTELHAQAGWDRYGPVPEAVTQARDSPQVQPGSDGHVYTRDAEGQWTREGWLGTRQASGNLRDELEATYTSVKALAAERSRDQTREPSSVSLQVAPDAPAPQRGPAWSAEPARPVAPAAPPAMPPRAGDLRDPSHPGHTEFSRTLREVRYMEAGQGIGSGPHSEKVAAALLVKGEREGLRFTNVTMSTDGQVQGLQRDSAFAAPKMVKVDPAAAQSGEMADYANQWAQLRSPHLVSQAPAAERSAAHTQGVAALSAADQAMFARIRQDVPAHIGDDHVAQAVLGAKQAGIADAGKIDRVLMAGDNLWVAGTTPGFRAATDVAQPVAPMQDTVQQAQAFNQQREQQLALGAQQRQQEGPGGKNGPAMG